MRAGKQEARIRSCGVLGGMCMSASRDAVFHCDRSRGSEGLVREVQLSHIITALSSRSQDFFGYHAD